MKTCVTFGAVFLVWGAASAVERHVVEIASLSNYEGRTLIEPRSEGFEVRRSAKTEGCTAWGVYSKRIAIGESADRWSLDFTIFSDREWYRVESSRTWSNAVLFYRSDGTLLGQEPLEIEFPAKQSLPFRFTGKIPKDSVFASVQFGVNSNPPILPGECVRVDRISFATYRPDERLPDWVQPDIYPPLVHSDVTYPEGSTTPVVRYVLEDQTGVDWARLAVTNLDAGVEIPYTRSGNVLTLVPNAPWSAGTVRLTISAADTLGNQVVAHKVFRVGETPRQPRVRLRDDGVTLIDGRPFFPIGIYGIKRHERNGNDYGAAFRELKAAGFNVGHSYADWKSAEFMELAERNEMRLWTNGKPALAGDAWFLDLARNKSANIAWYVGDDTSLNTTAQQLVDRVEACRLLDGSRITCHADGVGATRVKSNLQDYVNVADVFMPEIYPFDGFRDEQCVAEVCRDVDRCFSDYARFGRPGEARAVWPILQCFDGMSWKRYPKAQEMYATSFAALIHGGQGILWFTYGGRKSKTSRYSGMFRTEEDWAAMTNITHRIAALQPVLLARTPKQPLVPEIIVGPRTDPLGQPAVTLLQKNQGGAIYVLAVNAAPESVRARFVLECGSQDGRVAWEDRTVKARDGVFEDDFAAFGVHVYRFADGRKD